MNSLLFTKPLPRCRVITAAKKEEKTDRRKVFREKIMDSRKQSISDIGKNVNSLVKQEVSETRAIFDEHVKFFKQNSKTEKTKKTPSAELVSFLLVKALDFDG